LRRTKCDDPRAVCVDDEEIVASWHRRVAPKPVLARREPEVPLHEAEELLGALRVAVTNELCTHQRRVGEATVDAARAELDETEEPEEDFDVETSELSDPRVFRAVARHFIESVHVHKADGKQLAAAEIF
jgi:hypothetical protein